MALSERSRSTIYQTFEPLLGEEVVGEMLSYYPARDVEEPATKEFVRAEIAGVRTEVAELRATMHHEFRKQTQWMIGSFTAIAATLAAVMLGVARLIF